MPLLIIVMISMSSGGSGTEGGLKQLLGTLPPVLVMCILAVAMAYMSGMNPALSTAVSREGKGHDFIKALPVSARTLIHAKIAVGYMLVSFGVIAAGVAILIIMPGFTLETILAIVLCLIFSFGCSCMALSRDVKKPRLDWVTEQEAVKQNFGVLISMLISWGILAALAGLCYLMIDKGWEMLPVFGVLAAILTVIAVAAYKKLMKNVDKYYCAG